MTKSPLDKQLDLLLGQQADIDARSQRLDEREKSLDQREQSIHEREFGLEDKIQQEKVIDKRISVKKEILDNYDIEVQNLRQALERDEQAAQAELLRMQSAVRDAVNKANAAESLAKLSQTKIAGAERRLIEIKKDIKDNKDYLLEQEKTVNDTIAEWNVQLMEFSQEADRLTEEKKTILTTTTRLEQDKTAIVDKIAELDNKLQSLESLYNNKAEGFKRDLSELQESIEKERNKLAQLLTEHDARIKGLDTREKAAHLKEVTQAATDKELARRERKLRQDYNLLGRPIQ